MAQGRMRARELVTHRFELADYVRALATFTDRDGGASKVVLTP
jgi:L-iditol 2-dehydrogenase